MAAPTPTARGTPTGIRLQDGYRSTITFALDATINLWEVEVTPPGFDGGKAVDTTTMLNNTYETMAPQGLITMTGGKMTCAYDPGVITNIQAAVNRRDTITVTFKDGTTWAFFGYLNAFKPAAMVRGKMPTAEVDFTPTNTDSSGAEQSPFLTNVAGT